MALSETSRRIRKLFQLTKARKALEAESDALKEYFRGQAAGGDTSFKYGDLEVVVTSKERESWDSDKLVLELGGKYPSFKKTSQYQEVTCRKAKSA